MPLQLWIPEATRRFSATPLATIDQTNLLLGQLGAAMQTWQTENPTNFLIAQAAFGVSAVLLFGALLTLEFWVGRRRGVRIRTAEGGSAELDIKSIGRRLEWHLEQLAEIISVVPAVKSKGGSVNIKLEVETAPDVDVPMKTDEIVEVTRDIINWLSGHVNG